MDGTQVAYGILGGHLGEAEEESAVGEEILWCVRLLDLAPLVPHIYAILGVGCFFREVLGNV